MSFRIISLATLFATIGLSGQALAQDLVYTPVNPSFGGNPLNSSHLLGLANAQRDATASDANDGTGVGGGGGGTDDGDTDVDLFIRQLQGRLLSALASQVTEAIFGENPQDSGTITFGGTTVSFERTADSITLTIVDEFGTVTVISVPQLVTSDTALAASGALSQGLAPAMTAGTTIGSETLSGSLAGSSTLSGSLSSPLN
jgi:curli production assembly/transport component CsgF